MFNLLRRFRRDDEGSSTVEFVIIFPAFIAIVLSVFESGWLMTRYMMLDRGLDFAVRDLRLGVNSETNHGVIRDSICSYSAILKDCDTNMVVQLVDQDELDAMDAAALATDPGARLFPDDAATCQDKSSPITPDIERGEEHRIVYLRVCMLAQPIMPGVGLGLLLPKDANGDHQMISYTAFMNEPN